ncbi:MAG TPA: hypothetical protein VH143_09905 [Kofleriaceae bacterium]|jgi:hypothetical protein|nr:hypothetical protein [Kofleriaceae bacterium]
MRQSAVVLLVLACACGPNSRSSPGGDDDSGGDAGGGGGGGGGAGGGGSATGSDGCSDDAKLIYVVDQNNKLAKFDPSTKMFAQLGTLSCPAGTDSQGDPAEPFSMAVDRNAQAYVLFSDDKIYKVDTTQTALPCTATTWKKTSSLAEFGMGYSTDTMGGSDDTMFIAGGKDLNLSENPPTTSTLATLDTTAFSATNVGTVKGWPELTGNSNAELWGFFPDVDGSTAPLVTQIDKTSGAFLTQYTQAKSGPLDSGTPGAWAFGFYGGDYWVFLAYEAADQMSTNPTTVYQIAGPTSSSGTPGSVVSMTSAGSLVIVGAGVSTCAPTMIF